MFPTLAESSQNQNRYGGFSGHSNHYNQHHRNNNTYNNRSRSGSSQPQAYVDQVSGHQLIFRIDKRAIEVDLVQEKAMWPFSCYAHDPKDDVMLISGTDWSPEEARVCFEMDRRTCGHINNYVIIFLFCNTVINLPRISSMNAYNGKHKWIKRFSKSWRTQKAITSS